MRVRSKRSMTGMLKAYYRIRTAGTKRHSFSCDLLFLFRIWKSALLPEIGKSHIRIASFQTHISLSCSSFVYDVGNTMKEPFRAIRFPKARRSRRSDAKCDQNARPRGERTHEGDLIQQPGHHQLCDGTACPPIFFKWR